MGTPLCHPDGWRWRMCRRGISILPPVIQLGWWHLLEQAATNDGHWLREAATFDNGGGASSNVRRPIVYREHLRHFLVDQFRRHGRGQRRGSIGAVDSVQHYLSAQCSLARR